MIFDCTAHISYDISVSAKSREDAELIIFDRLADDVVIGSIRTDLFDNGSGPGLRFPFLHTIEVRGCHDAKNRERCFTAKPGQKSLGGNGPKRAS